jgi:alpha-tubulin suppressor-like RCC1 family protein
MAAWTTETLAADIAPSNATNKNVSWSSSNEAVATVKDGIVTGRAYGTATITVATLDGNRTDECAVTVVGGATIAAGASCTLAIKSDGSLWAWGTNYYGQFGIGSNTATVDYTPVQVSSDKNWAAISGTSNSTFALKSDGSLWAWGQNSSGQLGLGDTANRNVPIQVGTDKNWAAISGTGYHTLALKSDGSLWAWGSNNSGGLGDGTRADRNAPVQVGSDKNWAAVAASGATVALKTDGTLWAWGANSSSYADTLSDWNSPAQAGADRDWTAVSASNAILKADGSLWKWESVSSWPIVSAANRSILTQVGADKGWTTVAARNDRTFALKSDGSLYSWGSSNTYGQLGNGTSAAQNDPVQVGTGFRVPPK